MNRGYRWLAAAGVIFVLGVAAGGFAAARTAPETLYEYFAGFSGGEINIRTGTAVLDALVLWAVLFFSAFFRFGAVSSALAVGAKGFTDGYAVTAILRILGIKGIGLCFFDIFGAPLTLLMAAYTLCALTDSAQAGAKYLARSGLLLALMVIFAAAGTAAAGAIAGAVFGKLTL